MHALLRYLVVVQCCLVPLSASADDWPMWRHDAGRTGISATKLPERLHLHWVRQLPEPQPAWPASQTKLQFDRSYEPVVMDQRLFVGSTVNDSITAYDTQSGEELWRFYAEGPVRFAPVAAQGKVYAVSDDGHLYCLDAETGKLQWKVNGGPAKRPIIGNDRLVSTWPARGGVVLAEGTLYFTASIWPSMGIFIHAVDAETGQILWTNSETGSRYTVHPHGAESFGSIVPQGYLAVSGDYLVVPGGRSLPAVFDRQTGEMVHFDFGGKTSGGFSAMVGGGRYWVGGELFQLDDGTSLTRLEAALMTDKECIGLDGRDLHITSLAGDVETKTTTDRRGRTQKTTSFTPKETRSLSLDSGLPEKIFCQAGDRIYLGGRGKIAAVEFSRDKSKEPLKAAWSASIDETPTAMLAADERLFVVTDDHKLYCYGAEDRQETVHKLPRQKPQPADDAWTQQAESFIEAAPSQAGYAIALGIGSGRLIEELVRQTNFHIIAVDSDAEKMDSLRRKLDEAGHYGTRVAVLEGDPTRYPFPPYLADLVVVEEESLAQELTKRAALGAVFQALRPYGGVLVLPAGEKQHGKLGELIAGDAKTFAQAKRERQDGLTRLRREGALPNSGQWTHQYGDATNSVVSKDQLVKAPLGVLWFGGPSNDKVLPRHGHGPSPLVAGGRLVIEGPDMLRSVDVYTGRVHWEKDLPGVGEYYNVTRHFSGAGEVGSNYVTLADHVYVIHDRQILELDAATGETSFAYSLPKGSAEEPAGFGFLAVAGKRLVATSSPVTVPGVADDSAAIRPIIPKGFTAIVKPNAEWDYLAGSDPPSDWIEPEFSAKGWKQGQAGFGYGDDDDRTVLKDMPGNYTRVYVRQELPGDVLQDLSEVSLAINYDDGFIAYLNGKEILRKSVGKGRGPQASNISSHEAKGYETFAIKDFQKLIRPGNNVIAIEGHNTSSTSSDFSLDPYVLARVPGDHPLASKKPENSRTETKKLTDLLRPADKASSSRRLVVYDRKTRKELWSRDAEFSFRHNSIVVTGDRVFCIDSLSPAQLEQLKRRGVDGTGQARLLASDAGTGEVIWSTTDDVFGTFLNYSAEHDVLLQAGSAYRDRAPDEVGTGMVAYRGSTGEVIWKDRNISYNGPCLLWRDKIITNGSSGFQLGLFDGEKTGWKFSRMYGCNTVVGSEHLLTFRSGAAGFCDLTGDSGTGNLGGFKSSCTSNLIVADGVLNAPDYTRTCTCAYQNQTSVAWIHLPEADSWTFSSLKSMDHLERVGWNLGAPGDRRSAEGTLWFEYPNQGGPGPQLKVETAPEEPKWFRHHASTIAGEDLTWVAASGAEGLQKLALNVPEALSEHKGWTVRLYFSEPEDIPAGERVFSVQLQEEMVTPRLDIAGETGKAGTMLIKEYQGVKPDQQLAISLIPLKDSARKPLLCGVEIVPSTEGGK